MKFKLVESLDTRPKYLAEDKKIDLNKAEIVGYINNEGILVLPSDEDDEDWEDWNGQI